MKLPALLEGEEKSKNTAELQEILLNRIIKLRKLQKEMKDNVHIQKAQDALEAAKLPFKKVRSKWISEVEAIERELKSRDISYNVHWDEIYESED